MPRCNFDCLKIYSSEAFSLLMSSALETRAGNRRKGKLYGGPGIESRNG